MSKIKYLFGLIIITLLCSMTMVFAQDIDPQATLTYQAHVSDIGWQEPVGFGQTAGTTGQAKKIEALRISTGADENTLGITYTPHISNIGWTDPSANGADAGTTGQNLGIEAIRISLTGSQAPNYNVYYRVHSANFGWLDWAANGADAGTSTCNFPMEAIEIQILPADQPAPGETDHPYLTRDDVKLSLRTHVENIGWTDPVPGSQSGTTGQALKLQAVEAQVTDPAGSSGLIGQAYVENDGWQNEAGVNDAVGTTNRNLQLEAVRFRLKGAAAQLYDINYRVYVANLGWMPWTANNGLAGTTKGAVRMEAVDMLLVPKGTAAVQDGAYKEIQTPTGIIPPSPNCITISIDKQRMAYYENYDVIVDTNVVTGMAGIDDTKKGDWTVLEKLPNYRTKGPGYDAVVSYWLTLYRGDIYGFSGEGHIVDRVGIHDAGWRSAWGTNAYKTNGSHGCVNTPFNAMRTIYTRIPQGVPVRIR